MCGVEGLEGEVFCFFYKRVFRVLGLGFRVATSL